MEKLIKLPKKDYDQLMKLDVKELIEEYRKTERIYRELLRHNNIEVGNYKVRGIKDQFYYKSRETQELDNFSYFTIKALDVNIEETICQAKIVLPLLENKEIGEFIGKFYAANADFPNLVLDDVYDMIKMKQISSTDDLFLKTSEILQLAEILKNYYSKKNAATSEKGASIYINDNELQELKASEAIDFDQSIVAMREMT
ncbi:hypothetical protein AAEX28_13915 [Lentisphaerota bacterium WC36G]|nr:hypothetical protein LJT99_00665 [Lentisphaerae bacterium WC36]